MNKQHEKKMREFEQEKKDIDEIFRNKNLQIQEEHNLKMAQQKDKYEYDRWMQDQKYTYNMYNLQKNEKDLYNNYYN